MLERPDFHDNQADGSLVTIRNNAETFVQCLDSLENELVQIKNETPSDRLRHPMMLRDRLEGLISVVAIAEAAPPAQVYEVFDHLNQLLEEQFSRMTDLEEKELAELNRLTREKGIPSFQG